MNAETRFREMWNASETLKNLLPTKFLSTGWTARDDFPNAVVTETSAEYSLLTNAGFLRETVTVKLEVFSDSRVFLDTLADAVADELSTFGKTIVPTTADTWKLTIFKSLVMCR